MARPHAGNRLLLTPWTGFDPQELPESSTTDLSMRPASESADWLGQRQVFFIISLLHLREERAAATKRRNIGVTITSRSGAAAAHASHCSAHHVSLGGTDRTHRRQIAASSRQLSLRDSPLAPRRYLPFIDAYVWIKKQPCARGKKDWLDFKGYPATAITDFPSHHQKPRNPRKSAG
ncbi:hypothetical protein fugu_004631 [Takifugu bimaculatus]|uniref:Uncharacterized protein n=1 Tax=Takifugu bimaculatus TaxID=433685 RepID=A0A4Z2B8K8_9TELE|nr:hypothetical protein fugu_004631 [Takifugu bimaculatus]